MGKEIVYCAACGKILPESEFARGRAHTVDHSAWCTSCRPANPVTPRSLLRIAAASKPSPAPAPETPRFTRKRIAILAGAAAAVLASIAVVLLASGKGDAPPVAAMAPTEPPPAPADPAPGVLRELESFAASSGDAEAILVRCAEARPVLRGRPEESSLRRIEERARKGIEERTRLETLKLELEKKARETAAAPAVPPAPAPAPAPAPVPVPANLPPAVALASPRDGATFVSPAEITFVAEASDPDGKVARVEFFLEIVKLGEATQAPYSFTKAIALPGTYVLSAKAIDEAGAESTSTPVTITVTPGKKRGPFKGTVASVPGTIRAADYDEGAEGEAFHLLAPGPTRAGDGDSGVIALKPSEWLEYTIRVPASGTYAIEVQTSSKGPGGLFHIEFGRNDKTGPLAVPDTGGDRAWKSVSKPAVILELGEQTMRLVMDKAGPAEGAVHFHSIRISESEAPVVRKAEPAKADARKAARPDPLQIKVDEAVRKGLEHLKGLPNIHPQYKEIVLLTYLHAGVPENDPQLQALLKESLAFKADGYSARTYNISLLAMALEELDRVTYQKDLARCAQFLLDNECRNGQWGYGAPTAYPKDFPSSAARSVATPSKSKPPAGVRAPGAPPAVRVKPPVRVNLKVKPQKEGPEHGDNSNAQYAALGLRACHEAGILLPKESVERARKWWVDFQEPEDPKKKESRDVATGAGIGTPRGWGYLSDGKMPAPGYYGSTGSMTAGAVGAVCIYDFILGLDWKRDPSVRDGIAWLAEHFTVKGNPGKEIPPVPRADWHYYYLYALERVGMLVPTQHIGRADWYLEGAKHLVEAQQPDGSWNQSTYHNSPAVALDTCYAILFLRRVTRPLQDVATVDPFRKP